MYTLDHILHSTVHIPFTWSFGPSIWWTLEPSTRISPQMKAIALLLVSCVLWLTLGIQVCK